MKDGLLRKVTSRYGKIRESKQISGVHIYSFVFVLLLFISLPLSVFANDAGVDRPALNKFLQDLQNRSEQISSFYTMFTQEKRLAMFDAPVMFQGKLAMVPPDRLRWEFTSPVPSALIFNGSKGLRCSDGADPVQFSLRDDPVMKVVAEQLWLWLGGDYRALENRYLLEKRGDASLLVTPLHAQDADFLSSVLIEFDPQTLQPLRVNISEVGGDLTLLTFDRPIINKQLNAALFEHCGFNE